MAVARCQGMREHGTTAQNYYSLFSKVDYLAMVECPSYH